MLFASFNDPFAVPRVYNNILLIIFMRVVKTNFEVIDQIKGWDIPKPNHSRHLYLRVKHGAANFSDYDSNFVLFTAYTKRSVLVKWTCCNK